MREKSQPVIIREIDYPNQIPGRGNGVSITIRVARVRNCARHGIGRGSVTFNRTFEQPASLSEETNSLIVLVFDPPSRLLRLLRPPPSSLSSL